MSRALDIEVLTWQQVRDEVAAVNTTFAKIIDELDPDDSHILYKVKYPYGSQILQNGELYLPSHSNELLPFKSPSIDRKIFEDLNYNHGSNPATLVLSKSLELFFELEDRIVPYSIIQAGSIFGLWSVFDKDVSHCPQPFLWGLTSGMRSLFMLPKISESNGHARLRSEFHVSADKPKKLLDHWSVFREIANAPVVKDPWSTELLFFSKKWLTHQNDEAWLKLNNYLLNEAWQSSGYWRNQYIWDLIFSLIQKKKGIKPPAFLANIVKHLLAIGTGAVPGFSPALNDQFAPISQIQNAYIDVYGLKNYMPVIMQADTFDMNNLSSNPVYYSLQYPAAVEFAPKSYDKTSTLTDLYCAQSLLKKYRIEILSGKFNVESTPLYELVSKVDYDFFHSNTGSYRDIKNSLVIPDEDKSFAESTQKFKDRKFPKNGTFLNGCVRISHHLSDKKSEPPDKI